MLEENVSLIALREILSKFLPEAFIFSDTIMTYLKKFVETKSLNTKQCPTGLSPRIILHYSPKYLWETLGMGENPTQRPKIYRPPEISPLLNLLLLLSKESFLLDEIVIFI